MEYLLKVAPVLQNHAATALVPTVLLGLLCPQMWGISLQSPQHCAGSHFLPQPVMLKRLKLNGSMKTYKGLLELTPKKCPFHWNAKVGSQETPRVTGKFVPGLQNEAGQKLTDFCQENALVIVNTLFQQHKRRLYTWTSPDGQYKNQIDYILCSQRWRSSIQSAKTRPGADCGSDHELLIAKF